MVLLARRADPLDRAVLALQAAGCDAAWVSADLADRAAVLRGAAAAAEPFGEPDIVVNAAGVNIRPPLGELTTADWDTLMAVNLTAPFLLGQRFGPAMAARGWGRIVNIASQQAVRAFGNSGGYGAAKAGLAGLTRSQSEAWAPRGVRCNAIVPGFVATPLTADVAADPVRSAALAARTMIGRNGEPADFEGVGRLPGQPGQRLRHRADDLRRRRPVRHLTPGVGTPRGGPGGQCVWENSIGRTSRPPVHQPRAGRKAAQVRVVMQERVSKTPGQCAVGRKLIADHHAGPGEVPVVPGPQRLARAPGRPRARPPPPAGPRGAGTSSWRSTRAFTPGTARARASTDPSPRSSASWLLSQSATSGSTSKTRVFGDSSPARRSTSSRVARRS